MLLAAIPAVAVEFLIALTVGPPAVRALLLVPVAAVFAVCAWFLRKRFLVARQARIARPEAKLVATVRASAAAVGHRRVDRRTLAVVRRGPEVQSSVERVARRQPQLNTAPPSGALAASTDPPCCTATWRTIASPRPLPWRPRELAPRKNRSNT